MIGENRKIALSKFQISRHIPDLDVDLMSTFRDVIDL